MKTLCLSAVLLLGACTEVVDQGGHAAAGAALARDISRWATSEQTEDIIEALAHGREALQSSDPNTFCTMVGQETPEHWGEGKRRDLRFWIVGAMTGVK